MDQVLALNAPWESLVWPSGRLLWLLVPANTSKSDAAQLRSGVQSRQAAGSAGAKYTFTIKEGADGKNGRISVNYDGFIDDVSVNDMLLVDGGMLSLKILDKTKQDVVCEVVDGGVMGSRSDCPTLHCCLCLTCCSEVQVVFPLFVSFPFLACPT